MIDHKQESIFVSCLINCTSRCADDGDSTVQILYNGESSDSRFKFQMFKWRWSSDAVYLHCKVDICNKETETCTGEGVREIINTCFTINGN